MTETFVAAGVLLTSLSLTYVCCLRPLRSRGHHCCPATQDVGEIRRLRREVKQMQAQLERAYMGKPTGQ